MKTSSVSEEAQEPRFSLKKVFAFTAYIKVKAAEIVNNKHEGSDESIIAQVKSISVWSWFGSVLFFAFVLSNLSKQVTILALKPVVVPVTALAMALMGSFDITKVIETIGEKAGVAFVVTGILGLLLMVQNIYKGALFLQSLHPDYKKFRNHAVASILTPIATVGLLCGLMYYGFFFKFQTLIVSILALTLADSAGAVFVQVQEALHNEAVDLDFLKRVSVHVGTGLRFAIVLVLTLYTAFIVVAYRLTYKVLLYGIQKSKPVFEQRKVIVMKVFGGMLRLAVVLWDLFIKNFVGVFAGLLLLVFVSVIFIILTIENEGRNRNLANSSCSSGSTTGSLASQEVVLISRDGKGKCFGEYENSIYSNGVYTINNIKYWKVALLVSKKVTVKNSKGEEFVDNRSVSVPLEEYFLMQKPLHWEKESLSSKEVQAAVAAHNKREELIKSKDTTTSTITKELEGTK